MGNHAGSQTQILPLRVKLGTKPKKLHGLRGKTWTTRCGWNGTVTNDESKISCDRCREIGGNDRSQAKDERRIA